MNTFIISEEVSSSLTRKPLWSMKRSKELMIPPEFYEFGWNIQWRRTRKKGVVAASEVSDDRQCVKDDRHFQGFKAYLAL